ncbi:MAG: hypothetical protein F6K31_21335 [Symploca sp. SIO2G7]|nr:hypothetical protein [Symploca sp. SIO2G7]
MVIIQDSSGNRIQHVYGGINPDGSKWCGEGFRHHKLRQGLYLIEFERPFAGMPTPICTIFGPEWETFDKSISIVDIAPFQFVCATSSMDRPIDCGFTFIVFGQI